MVFGKCHTFMPSLYVKLSLYQQSVGWEEQTCLPSSPCEADWYSACLEKSALVGSHSSKQQSGQTRSPTTILDVLAPPIPHFQMSAINHLTGELTMDCNFIGFTIYSTLKV